MERKGGGGRGPSVICPYVTIMIQYDTISWGDFSGELCTAQCPNLIRPDRNYVVSNRCEEEPQSHFFFSFFFNYATYSCKCRGAEMNWTGVTHPPKNAKLSSHTRVYCGARSAAGKTRTRLQFTQWTHTSVSLSCSTPRYRVTRYKQTRAHCPLIQGGCSGPATLSMCFSTSRTFTHNTRNMLMIDASHRPISRLSQTW